MATAGRFSQTNVFAYGSLDFGESLPTVLPKFFVHHATIHHYEAREGVPASLKAMATAGRFSQTNVFADGSLDPAASILRQKPAS